MQTTRVPATRYELERAALGDLLADEPGYRVDQLWDGLYGRLADVDDISNLPAKLRRTLVDALPCALEPVTESTSDDGQTVKWLFALGDGATIETVLMHYPERSTVCVSSQAGCAMGCTFCATGQAGFTRHLTTGEIVEQVVRAARRSAESGRRLSNVVFMGMGEPLANFDRLWPAVERIHGAIGLSARHLTVSTVGVVPGIRRLAAEALPVNLAVSLHAANDELRVQPGAAQRPLPPVDAGAGVPRLPRGQEPAALLRVGAHRRRQRPRGRRPMSWRRSCGRCAPT